MFKVGDVVKRSTDIRNETKYIVVDCNEAINYYDNRDNGTDGVNYVKRIIDTFAHVSKILFIKNSRGEIHYATENNLIKCLSTQPRLPNFL